MCGVCMLSGWVQSKDIGIGELATLKLKACTLLLSLRDKADDEYEV